MHWYVLSKATETATLCAGEHDARREARSYDRLYPRAAPHVAVRLVPVLDTAGSDAVGRDVALALEWARAHAGEHADTIIEALTAYDPERAGARTVSRTAQAPERRAVTDEDVRRALDAFNGAWRHSPDYILDPSSNAFGMHQMRAALESLAGVPAAQPAPDAAREPVAWRYKLNAEKPEQWSVVQQWPLQYDSYEDREKWTIEPLYTHPASAASEAADVQLADTQRAIIEAAEARGYARAKTEGEADARELVRIPWTYNYWSEGVFGSPTNAANIVAYNGEDVAAIAYVPDAGERARIIEKHNNIVRRIEALAAQQRKGG